MDHVVPCQSSCLTLIKNIGAFTAKVSSLGAINNQRSFRHAIQSKNLTANPLEKSILEVSNLEKSLKHDSDLEFFDIFMLYEYNLFIKKNDLWLFNLMIYFALFKKDKNRKNVPYFVYMWSIKPWET